MYNAQDRRIPFDIRIDPRDVGAVYYIRDGVFHKASLMSTKTGQSDFAGLTLSEWTAVMEYLSKKRREREISDQDYDAYLAEINDMIVRSASKRNMTDASSLLENRREEKEHTARANAMLDDINAVLLKKTGGAPDETLSIDMYDLIDDEEGSVSYENPEDEDSVAGAPDSSSTGPEAQAMPDAEPKTYEEHLKSIEEFPEGFFQW